MAYTNNPSTNLNDQVRLLVGDISTSTSAEILADTDYTFFRESTPNVFAAACLAANSLAALFTTVAGSSFETKQVGDLRLSKGQAQSLADSYRRLCEELKLQSAKRAAKPYSGGISRSDKRSVHSDSDRVKPFFSRELFDNRDALDPLSGLSTST